MVELDKSDNILGDGSSVDDIPGLGPIRCRSIKKAGYNTAGDLRRLTVDDIAGIRGITEIKARQIFLFLKDGGQSVTEVLKEIVSDTSLTPNTKVKINSRQRIKTENINSNVVTTTPPVRVSNPTRRVLSNPTKPVPQEIAIDCLTETVHPYDIMTELASRANLVLRSPQSVAMKKSLARQTARIAGLPDFWEPEVKLGPKRRERAVQAVVQLRDALPYPAAIPEMSNKMQEKLADELRRCRRLLQDAID